MLEPEGGGGLTEGNYFAAHVLLNLSFQITWQVGDSASLTLNTLSLPVLDYSCFGVLAGIYNHGHSASQRLHSASPITATLPKADDLAGVR